MHIFVEVVDFMMKTRIRFHVANSLYKLTKSIKRSPKIIMYSEFRIAHGLYFFLRRFFRVHFHGNVERGTHGRESGFKSDPQILI